MKSGAEGLRALLIAHRAELLRFLQARMGNSAGDAEDILQKIWMKLETAHAHGPIAEPLAYLYRIAENSARDHQRSAARRRAREELWAGNDNIEGRCTDAEPSPEAIAIERDRLRRLATAFTALPERTQAIFRACRLDRQPQREVARRLGISLSAVEKHLQKAYKFVSDFRTAEDAEKGGE